MKTLSEIELPICIEKAQQGDANAFTVLVQCTQNLVTSTALSLVYDVQASEDIAQSTFLDAWQQLHKLKSPDSFLPWLRQITRNKAKNYLRSRGRTAESVEELDTVPSETELSSALEQQQIQQKVADIVAALPAEHRDILILYYREQQNSAQVAELLDMSEANVRQKLSRLRQQVKADLLAEVGDILWSCAPSVAFTSTVLSSLGISTPAAAASIASAKAAKATGVSKYLALFSGAMVGGLVGISAILLASTLVQRKLTDAQQKALFKRHTQEQIIWVVVSMIALSFAYELTSGWLAPVVTFSVFVAGLIGQQLKLHRSFKAGHLTINHRGYLKGWIGLTLGTIGGFTGLIVGLINSGRLIF